MPKQELVNYLAGLISVMESKEDAGIARGQTLGREYNRAYEQLLEIIRKEEADEARTSKFKRDGESETGTDSTRGLPRIGEPAGESRRSETGSGDLVRR